MRSKMLAVAVASALCATAITATALNATQSTPQKQQAKLTGRAVLPAQTFRAGSAPSGTLISSANGVAVPFAEQPVQGVSGFIPGADGTWWALSDNGYGSRGNSADYELSVYKVDVDFDAPSVAIVGGFSLSDPDGHVAWKIVCDQVGDDLPARPVNAFPVSRPALCGDAADRKLTGFDFDLESIQIARDGSFWFGDEFGPFLLHTDQMGRLIEPPIPMPGVNAEQSALLPVTQGANLATSRGFEGMGISPNRRFLFPMLEGPLLDDDRQDLRISEFDTKTRSYTGRYWRVKLEMPGAKLGSFGPNAIGELTFIDDNRAIYIERDGGGDAPNAPRFKKVFEITLTGTGNGTYVKKDLLVDLMAIPDPDAKGGDGSYFRMPFTTIESVHVLDSRTLVVVNDNNFPFSNGRSFANGQTLAPDATEFVRIGLGETLQVRPAVLVGPS